jgi:hypothetical protein
VCKVVGRVEGGGGAGVLAELQRPVVVCECAGDGFASCAGLRCFDEKVLPALCGRIRV